MEDAIDGLFGRHRSSHSKKHYKSNNKKNEKELEYLPDGSHISPQKAISPQSSVIDEVAANEENTARRKAKVSVMCCM